MFDLTGKVALVTGAAHGLGKGIAICLAKAGAHVVINDICEPKEAEDALSQVETAEKPAVFSQADVSEEAEDGYKRQVYPDATINIQDPPESAAACADLPRPHCRIDRDPP